jgi:DNA polymerase zeta
MRQKKNAVLKSLKKDERTVSAPPKIDHEITEKSNELKRVKSSEGIHPKGMQRVVVKIPKYVPRKKRNLAPKLGSLSAESSLSKKTNILSKAITKYMSMDVEPTFTNPNNAIEIENLVGQSQNSSNENVASSYFGNKNDQMSSSLEDVQTFGSSKSFQQDIPDPISPVFNIFHDSTFQTQVIEAATDSFRTNIETKELVYRPIPPRIYNDDLPKEGVVYKEPFYSRPSDVPRFPTVFADKEFKLPTVGLPALKEFKSLYGNDNTLNTIMPITIKAWTPSKSPPLFKQVQDWIKSEAFTKYKSTKQDNKTQLDHPTLNNTFNFKFSASKPVSKVKRIRDYIDYFSLEIHVNTREQLLPDPEHDAVQLVFWCFQTENLRIISNGYQEGFCIGVIAMKDFEVSRIGICNSRLVVDYADTEEQLFSLLIGKIRYYDPDMLVGYEIQNASWGYLVERGAQLGYHLLDELSRVMITSESIKRNQWGYQKTSVYRVTGRHMLNVWRLMKSELTLTSYTFENIAYNLLHNRVPHYSHATLTSWYTKGPAVLKYRLFKYYMKRVQLNLDMLDASQVVNRTCESARVYGIDFYAVISRGSQYNVESIMFRIAKPENFVLITPSRSQVSSQRSLEILPLIMEPISQFYSSPMVVLDFQSLYPSIMIAYNYW